MPKDALIYACQYIKSMASCIILSMNYGILNNVILSLFTENIVFLCFAIFKKHPIFETLWQEQGENKRLVLQLKVLRKGSSMLRIFIFSFNEG